jgi:tetratricopeptide (TPR) repeat protein
MNRRRFMASAVAAGLFPKLPVAAQNQFESAPEDFPLEAKARQIAAHLKRLPETRTLPFASGFHGISPMPIRYRSLAEGVSQAEYDLSRTNVAAGLTQWFDSLGSIRAARFFVLPNDMVRFEIASADRYRVGVWKQRWENGAMVYFAPVEEVVTTAPEPLFHDITAQAFRSVESFHHQLRQGVPYWRAHLDAASGIDVHGHNGVAVGDIDNDGVDEVYVCQPGGLPNRLYKNHGGIFEDITDKAGVAVLDPTSCALFLDLRNSGHQDLVVLRPDGPLLLLNQGGGRFTHQPGAFHFRTTPQGSFTGMAAADYDRDGRLDLYLCTYSFFRDGSQYRYPTPYYDAQNGPANFLLRNELDADGSGVFQDVTDATGLNHNNNRFSFAPAWCDYNDDGWPDLFVANDFGRKNLYRNQGGKFRDVAAEAGVEDIGDGMSAAWFDYNGDGRPDLYVSNMWSDAGQRIVSEKQLQPAEAWKRHPKGNSLYRNRGDGTFEETGALEGVEMGRWAWSADGIDFDNDGIPEILVTAGMLTNSSETDLESFFWRRVAAASPEVARPDAAYENGWNALSRAAHEKYSEAGRQTNVFYVRRGGKYYDFSGISGLDCTADSRAFAVTDLDGDGNLDLILKSRLGPQVRVFQNNCGWRHRTIAFRLQGVKSNRDAIGARIEVDGKVKFVAAGSGYLSQHTKVMHFGLGDDETAHLIRITWPSGQRQEFHSLSAGRCYRIEEGSEHLSASAFSPRAEISAGAVEGDNTTQFADTWLLQALPLPELLQGPGILRLSALSAERTELYSIFCRYLFDLRADVTLPIWLLVDERSQAHKIYFLPPDPSDAKRLNNSDRLALALPARGRYYTEPARNYTALGAAFASAGYPDQALRYLELAPQDNDRVLFAIGKIHLQARRWERAGTYFRKGLALAPDSADGWNSLGAAELGTGNMQEALKHFQRSLEARRDYAPAIENLASFYAIDGRPKDAIAALRYGIQVAPDNESFYLALANVYAGLGDNETARSVIGLLLERKPGSGDARKALRELESK